MGTIWLIDGQEALNIVDGNWAIVVYMKAIGSVCRLMDRLEFTFEIAVEFTKLLLWKLGHIREERTRFEGRSFSFLFNNTRISNAQLFTDLYVSLFCFNG